MSDAFKLPCSTYFFASYHTLAFFQVLLCTSAFFLGLGSDMAHAFSLLRWQLLASRTQHAFVPLWCHTANSATFIFGSLQFEFGSMVYISMSIHIKFAVEHSAAFGSSYAPGPFYQVNKLYSFPPLV